jgi:hypothetical protein
MSNVLKMLSRGGAAAAETDPNFKQTVLLLHGDGTNGAQNNTFLDSSTNNFTITRNGNTTQGTFSPFSAEPGNWGNYFNGSTGYIASSSNTAFALPGAFTFECWFYPNSFDQVSAIGDTIYSGIATGSMSIGRTSAGFGNAWGIAETATLWRLTTTTLPTNNTWNHMVAVRDGSNNTALFLNGTRVASGTVTTSFGQNGFSIGSDNNAANSFLDGYLSNVRIVKGRAVYDPTQTTLTVPTAPLGATSGGTNPPQGTETSLLTCQSNRFVDNGGLVTKNTITRNGDVRVTPFSPFAPTAAYSAGTNGGSGYFDGTGDYLSVANNAAFEFSTGDFTVEAWVYLTSLSSRNSIISGSASGAFDIQLTVPTYSINVGRNKASYDFITSYTLRTFEWNHVAITRESGTIRCFVNGDLLNSASNIISYGPNGGSTTFGASDATEHFLNGYVNSLRVVKGTAVYTGAFTPPIAPISTSGAASASAYPSTTNVNTSFASSATSLLLNFTNAGIFDNTGKNNLETVGNAQIDTTTKKFGTGSMEFDGNGDILVARNIELLDFPSGDFTVEFWYNTNTLTPTGPGTAGYGFIVGKTNWNGTNSGAGWSVFQFNQTIVFFYPGSTLTSIATGNVIIATNTWYHIAVVRSGTATNNTKIYINGVQQAQGTPTITSSTQPLVVGEINTSYGWDIRYATNGYIDDLRITKGVARYTANFTAPTKEFPDQ